MIPNTVTAAIVITSICLYLLMGSGSKRSAEGFITSWVYFVGVLVGLLGAYPPHTFTRTASATHPHLFGRKSAIGWQIDPPGPAIARNDGGSCPPDTKKAEIRYLLPLVTPVTISVTMLRTVTI
jgi:hypothetical protein